MRWSLLPLLAITSSARAEPDRATLVEVGLALAPVDYLAGVALHEGSHALGAKLVGATVDELHVFPPGTDPHAKVFRFGWTYVHGLHTTADRVAFLIAPKITDTALLAGYAALVFAGGWPDRKYGQLALTVAATGLWIDFAKDVVLFSPQNDVTKILDLWNLTGWRELPARLVYAALDVGWGYVVLRGYERLFERDGGTAPALVLPITQLMF